MCIFAWHPSNIAYWEFSKYILYKRVNSAKNDIVVS